MIFYLWEYFHKMSKIKILSTKKLHLSESSMLSDSKFDWTEEDFIRIEFLDFETNTDIDLLLFTSKNAVLSVLKNKKIDFLKQIKCICVGEKTEELLEENGFKVLDFAHYAEDLTKIISKKHSGKSFAFFCGNLRRDVLPDFFKEKKIEFHEIQVYKNEFSSKRINKKFDAILFFSPSGVMSFLEKNRISDEVCFCIGTTTSEALEPYTKNIILSEKPTITSVLEKVKEYFFNFHLPN